MNRILFVLAGVVAWEFVKANFNPLDNIRASFKKIDGLKIKLLKSRIDLTINITNSNPFPIQVANVRGHLKIGNLMAPVNTRAMIELLENQTVNGGFTVTMKNDEFMFALAGLIEAKQIPELIFDGYINGGLQGKTFSLPITQRIPISIL